jgi:predicted branched-subunit amino acid permease
VAWTTSSTIGAAVGRSFGDPAAVGLDFAFSALFISIIAGFWKGSRTGAVLAASAIAAVLVKFAVPGAWYIVAGGLAGVVAAAILHTKEAP